MPSPDDLERILHCVRDVQRELEGRSDAGELTGALRNANGLLKLGGVRAQENDWLEAERLLSESATSFWTTGLAFGRECAAMARIGQASAAMAQDHYAAALGIFDRLIEQFDGFPTFDVVPAALPAGLDAWLLVLRQAGDDQRLYDAAGTALGLLDPLRSKEERATTAHALLRRAESAQALGHIDEAVEMYDQVVAEIELDDTSASADYPLEAMLRVAVLLGSLERDEEANAAFARIVAWFGTSTQPLAQQAVNIAQQWIEASED